MKLKLKVPDHTTLSSRGKTIRPKISCHLSPKKPLHIIVDSTESGIPVRVLGQAESREVETILGCKILNRFLEFDRCKSKIVAEFAYR